MTLEYDGKPMTDSMVDELREDALSQEAGRKVKKGEENGQKSKKPTEKKSVDLV